MDSLNAESFPVCPVWLEEEGLPRSLLERFIEKLNKGQQRLSLRLNHRNTPELYDFESENVPYRWELVQSLEREYRILTIRPERPRPGREAFENALVYFNADAEGLVRYWLNRPALAPYDVAWSNGLAIMKAQFEDGGEALREKAPLVAGKSPEQMLAAFSLIGSELQTPMTLRTLSARCFWGDSKFLDRNVDLVRALFPSLAHNVLPRPILMSVYLPQVIEHVLFVENQDSFIALTQLNLPGHALVYSAGFRGSAQRIRDTGNVAFSYLNPAGRQAALDTFESWWFYNSDNVRAWFWGDLDFSGMAILKALRQVFADTRAWEPGYAPLLTQIQQGRGHAHDSSNKSLQKDPKNTGCEFADLTLLPAMRTTDSFVDQEAVKIGELRPDLSRSG